MQPTWINVFYVRLLSLPQRSLYLATLTILAFAYQSHNLFDTLYTKLAISPVSKEVTVLHHSHSVPISVHARPSGQSQTGTSLKVNEGRIPGKLDMILEALAPTEKFNSTDEVIGMRLEHIANDRPRSSSTQTEAAKVLDAIDRLGNLVQGKMLFFGTSEVIIAMHILKLLRFKQKAFQLDEGPIVHIAADLMRRVQEPEVLRDLGAADAALLLRQLGYIMRGTSTASLSALYLHLTAHIAKLEPVGLANVALGLARLGCNDSSILNTVGQQVVATIDTFPSSLLVKVLHAYGTRRWNHPALFTAASRRILQVMSKMEPKEMSAVLWAYARTNAYDTEVLTTMANCLAKEEVLEALPPRSLAQLVWALAIMGFRDEKVTTAIAIQMRNPNYISPLSPNRLANVMWAYVSLDFKDEALLNTIVKAIMGHQQKLCPAAVSASMYSLTMLQDPHPDFMAYLAGQALTLAPELELPEICNIAWVLGTYQYADAGLLNALGWRFLQLRKLSKFERFRGISRLFWSFATLNIQNSTLFGALADSFMFGKLAASRSAQEVAQMAWSLSTLNYVHVPLMEALGARVTHRNTLAPSFLPIARMYTAFAKLKICDKTLFDQWGSLLRRWPNFVEPRWLVLVVQAYGICNITGDPTVQWVADLCHKEAIIAVLTTHELSLLAGGFISAGLRDKEMFRGFAEQLLHKSRLNPMDGADIAKMLFCLVNADVQHEELLQVFGDRLCEPGILQSMAPVDLARVAWGFASMGVLDARLMTLLANQVLQTGVAATLSCWSISNIAWSFATLNVLNVPMMTVLVDQALVRLYGFTPQGLANFVWAHAQLNLLDSRLVDAVIQFIPFSSAIGEWDTQAITSCLWALTVSNVVDDAVFAFLMTRQRDKVPSSLGLCQIHQTFLHIQLNAERMPMSRACVQESLAYQARTTFYTLEKNGSLFQKDVARILRSMGALAQEEVTLEAAGGYSADILCNGQGIVVEVDGPSHFVWNGTGYHPLGSTALKRRQIAGFGYTVVAVPFYEWTRMTSAEEKSSYLKELLADAVGHRQQMAVDS